MILGLNPPAQRTAEQPRVAHVLQDLNSLCAYRRKRHRLSLGCKTMTQFVPGHRSTALLCCTQRPQPAGRSPATVYRDLRASEQRMPCKVLRHGLCPSRQVSSQSVRLQVEHVALRSTSRSVIALFGLLRKGRLSDANFRERKPVCSVGLEMLYTPYGQ
jgi:hypothetical protein